MPRDITVVKSMKELKKGLEHYGRQEYWQPLHRLNHQKLTPAKIQSYDLLQTRKRNGGEDWIIEVSFQYFSSQAVLMITTRRLDAVW